MTLEELKKALVVELIRVQADCLDGNYDIHTVLRALNNVYKESKGDDLQTLRNPP